MYDPNLKRWLQPDPRQTEGVRTYVYFGNDPVDVTDATSFSGGICGWGSESTIAVNGRVYIADQAGHLTAYALPGR